MDVLLIVLSVLTVTLGGAAAWVWRQLDALKGRFARIQAKAAELQAAVERSLKDRDETVRRIKGQAEQGKRYAHEPLLKDIIESLDNFDRALALPERDGDGPLREGILLTRTQLLGALERHGVARLDAVKGDDFDPAWQEAIAQQVSDQCPPGRILAPWVAGYKLHDRLVRPAKVVIATAPEEPAVPPQEEVGADLALGATVDQPLGAEE
jgi:molecular chaperone GrpE